MSKKTGTYFSQYESPNIVIVPTVSLCKSSPSKKVRLEDIPNVKTEETISYSKQYCNPAHKILMKKAEQSKDENIVKIHKNVSTETMPKSEKITNQMPEMKQGDKSDNNYVKMGNNTSKETISSSGKTTLPGPKVVMKIADEYQCKYNMETEENVSKDIMIYSPKITNQVSELEEPKDNSSVKIVKNIEKHRMSSSEISITLEPEIVTQQTGESKDNSNVNIKDTAYKKKVNTSWASNYMESIGQIHKQTAGVTLSRLKTHKSQKEDVSKTNEGVKTIKRSLPNEASKDKHKLTPQKSTQLPQKPRKCKKIKLAITVVFKEPKSSSDTESNDSNDEDEPYVHADMSFLEDINVDEIVKSLCENISSKKEEGPCKGNDTFEENNNIKSNEVSKENKFRTDFMEEKLLIPSEHIKIDQKSYNKKVYFQSKDNIIQKESQVINIKTKDRVQTTNPSIKLVASKDGIFNPSLEIKPDDANEKPQKSCSVIEHNPKIKYLTPNLVTKCDEYDAKKRSLLPMTVVKSEDAKEKPLTSQPQTSSLSMKSVISKSKPNSLMYLDRVLAENIKRRMFQYLNEKFTVISNIHNGKYSKIYHVMDSKKKNYAVKILNNKCVRSNFGLHKENMLKKLQREIPRDHLQFVYIHNGFSMNGYWCFLMDFYPQNLDQALKEHNKPFHIDKVQDLARQLVTAVTILRNNNIVHSDIKPGHILLNCAKDTLKVCGFDGSYLINYVKILPNIGTLSYRAPEIILGHSAGYSIDVWATALVMFEMATNTKLFPGSYNNNILYKQICTLGTLPYHMLQKSLFRDYHFLEDKFIRRVGLHGQKTLILNHFYKNNRLREGIFKAYRTYWFKYRSGVQQDADLKKLGLFHLLLQQMLVFNPDCRLAIEFVYANPFIYEFC